MASEPRKSAEGTDAARPRRPFRVPKEQAQLPSKPVDDKDPEAEAIKRLFKLQVREKVVEARIEEREAELKRLRAENAELGEQLKRCELAARGDDAYKGPQLPAEIISKIINELLIDLYPDIIPNPDLWFQEDLKTATFEWFMWTRSVIESEYSIPAMAISHVNQDWRRELVHQLQNTVEKHGKRNDYGVWILWPDGGSGPKYPPPVLGYISDTTDDSD